MNAPSVVVLDENCANLAARVELHAPTMIFRRSRGFLCESSVAAEELRGILSAHGWLGRALYVAPSFAGFTALLLAARDQAALAAVVLLDPSHPRQSSDALEVLADAPPSPGLEALRSLVKGFGPAWDRSCEEVSAITTLGDLPLHVLAAGRFDLSAAQLPETIEQRLLGNRHAMLAEYCRLSTRATFTRVEAAGHDLARLAPEAVLASIRSLMGSAAPKLVPTASRLPPQSRAD